MPDRRGLTPHRTDRPEVDGVTAAVLPTVREVLRFDDVTRALPELLAGDDALDRPVRWVHVFETAQAARLVSGGELLLSTGVGWPSDDAGLRALAGQLARDRIAGLVLELSDRMPAAPPALVAEFRATGLPLVVLHREARFIAITEAVHSRIIADQMVALRARDEIHELFTELSLRGSPADFIVEQASRVLASPVVLEDLNHQVIAAETSGSADESLDGWEQRSRSAHRGDGDDGWLITPVEARGIRWGHLIALPGDPHPAGRSNVLEQAAVALALSRLADRDQDEWTRRSHDRLLGALLGRRFASESGLVARFEAAGFAVADRRLTGVAVTVRSAGVDGPRIVAAGPRRCAGGRGGRARGAASCAARLARGARTLRSPRSPSHGCVVRHPRPRRRPRAEGRGEHGDAGRRIGRARASRACSPRSRRRRNCSAAPTSPARERPSCTASSAARCCGWSTRWRATPGCRSTANTCCVPSSSTTSRTTATSWRCCGPTRRTRATAPARRRPATCRGRCSTSASRSSRTCSAWTSTTARRSAPARGAAGAAGHGLGDRVAR